MTMSCYSLGLCRTFHFFYLHFARILRYSVFESEREIFQNTLAINLPRRFATFEKAGKISSYAKFKRIENLFE